MPGIEQGLLGGHIIGLDRSMKEMP